MTNNKLTPWRTKIFSENQNEFFVDILISNEEGLRIILSDENNERIEIIWSNEEIISYRNTDENYFIYGVGQFEERKKIRKNFYIILNSEYVDFINKWTYPDIITKTSNLIHFAIYTVQDCIDVISTYEPIVRKI